MRVDVLVVVTLGQGSVLPAETLAAGVALTARAVAVAAPVPDGPRRPCQHLVIREHAATLTHRDVVRGVERTGRDVPEGTHHPALVGRSQGVAAVLHEPQVMLPDQSHDGNQIVRIAKRMRQEYGFGLRSYRLLEFSHVDIVRSNIHVNEHGNHAMLDYRVDGCWESSGHRNDFVTGLQPLVAEQRTGQGSKGHEVGGRTRVDEERVFRPGKCAER